MKKNKFNLIKKGFLVSLGILSFIIGSLGIILPVVPTTPFYFLAALCFYNSSPILKKWLENKSVYKKTVGNFKEKGGLSLKAKLSILIPVLIMLSIAFILINNLFVRILILCLICAKTIFFLKTKTLK